MTPLLAIFTALLCTASADDYGETQATGSDYVFGWLDYPEQTVKLRGGTSRGAPVTLATEPSEAWKALQAPDLSDFDRDRAAILALAGDYRTSFDFLETEVYTGDGTPSTPYRSWGTERVYVLADEGTFIQLQHIMVMFIVDDEGVTQGPIVMKHWRQDWTYEPTSLMAYRGKGEFTVQPTDPEARAGTWSQTVYQVDDSPRYALAGTWEHNAAFSSWQSEPGWRPLPRRERSVRDDYHVLDGTNRLTVHPRGWIHHQDNLKAILKRPGEIDTANPVVAREIGLDRYDRLVDFDFSAGDAQWEATADYWAEVRASWDKRLQPGLTWVVSRTCDGQPSFAAFFGMAAEVEAGKGPKKKKLAHKVDELIDCVAAPLITEMAAPVE
jgi:hypothetical protein